MYKEYLSNDIITFPEYANKIVYNMASDISDSIEYRMNEHGYRSNSFTDKGKIKILTIGCSWTMVL